MRQTTTPAISADAWPLRKLWAFVRLTRPVFLVGGALMFALGLVAATATGEPPALAHVALGFTLVACTQLMTHYLNEFYDLPVDRLNLARRTFFSGGSGVLPRGELPPRVARRAALVCAAGSVFLIAAVFPVSLPASLIGLAMLLGSWSYSAPPLPLAGSGFGEVAASLIVALLVPLLGFTIAGGAAPALLLALLAPLVLIHIAMMMAFEFADYRGDRAGGKRTLTVRLGPRRALRLHGALLALAFVLIAALAFAPADPIRLPALYALIAAPAAAVHVLDARHALLLRGSPQRVGFAAVALFAATGALMLAGLLQA